MTVVADDKRRKCDVRVLAKVLGLKEDVVYGTSSKVGPSQFGGGELTPTFSVRGAETEVLGVDTRSGQPSLCMKKMDGWTSVYSTVPCVAAVVLRHLAKNAGVHFFVEENAVVYANASVLSVTVNEPGPRRILLPGPMEVVDAITGQRVNQRADVFDWMFKERESCLFFYRKR